MRRPSALAVAFALALAVVAGAVDGAKAGQADAGPRAAVQKLLNERVRAVRSGDEAAFMATVDPRAPASFVESQRRQFRGLSQLPLTDFRLTAVEENSGNLVAAIAGRYPGADARYLPETRQQWQLTESGPTLILDRLWLSYVERDGQWFVAGDADVADLGLVTPLGLWDGGPVEVVRSGRVAMLTHPQTRARAQELAGLTDQAVDAVTGWDWPQRVVGILPADPNELKNVLRTSLDPDKFVAFVTYDAVTEPEYRSTAPRLYVQDKNLSTYSRRFQLETLVHELIHAAAAPANGPNIPSWVHEGVADWQATGASTGLRRPPGSDRRIPEDHELASGSRDEILVSYQEARSAISTLAAVAGANAPIELFRTLGQLRNEPGSDDHRLDRALRHVTNGALDRAALERRWAER